MTETGLDSKDNGISVVVTTYNAIVDLPPLLSGLERQKREPDELIVVDAGSSDGTVERLHELGRRVSYPVRVEVVPGAGISAGRNTGVRAATHRWIAVTDAGCHPSENWLAALDSARADADFISGIYQVVGETAFERVLSAALYPDPDEIGTSNPVTLVSQRLYGRRFGPSEATGRSMAFTKEAWQAVGGYSEGVVAGEDVAFSKAIVGAGFRHTLAPDAVVSWRPRPTWSANARMYIGYARGDVRFGFPKRHLTRASAWTTAAVFSIFGGRLGRAASLAWLASYSMVPFRRAIRRRLPVRHWWQIPPVLVLKDFSMLLGAVLGVRDARRSAVR